MTKFVVEIDCDNAAFEDNMSGEVGRLLMNAARLVDSGLENLPLFDINGNNVGRAFFAHNGVIITAK